MICGIIMGYYVATQIARTQKLWELPMPMENLTSLSPEHVKLWQNIEAGRHGLMHIVEQHKKAERVATDLGHLVDQVQNYTLEEQLTGPNPWDGIQMEGRRFECNRQSHGGWAVTLWPSGH